VPSAPLKPCSYPGCGRLVQPSERRCHLHSAQEQRQYDREQRSPEVVAFYHSRFWRRLSVACKERARGLCEECNRSGAYNTGCQADHIVPREQGGADDLDNLQWLCRSCHSRKSAEEGSRWGKGK
jgi:5-methylcytosine-specific restriction protein A